MKNILTTLVLISINICVFAQRTNNRGEYLVKSIHWVNAFTQKEVGNKGDKWYHFKYNDNRNMIEVRKEYYQNFKNKTVEIFTLSNNRYQFISYVNGKQEPYTKCEFTFNEQGYIDKLYDYSTKGVETGTLFTLIYYDNGELKSIDSAFEEKGGNRYKIHNYEEYTWENGNMIKYHYTNDDNIVQTFDIHYGNKTNNTNINLSSLIKHYNSPYNEHILFATEWCGKKPNNLISYQDMKDDTFDYTYEGNLLKKINKKNSSYSKGYYLIEYVY
ncbi:hypothetical protein [Bacteroides thetaiotaomicron]|uniref:hypothetical protein n=1 Tax=Bacteroides thetaiotaomicron TaxID=818 RepID=UPI0034A3FC17